MYEIPFSNGTYSQSVSLGTFQQPWGIAVDGSDNVYIVENSTSDVMIKETPTLTPYGTVWTRARFGDKIHIPHDSPNAGHAASWETVTRDSAITCNWNGPRELPR